MSSYMQKLSYAYGSLMTKTAVPGMDGAPTAPSDNQRAWINPDFGAGSSFENMEELFQNLKEAPDHTRPEAWERIQDREDPQGFNLEELDSDQLPRTEGWFWDTPGEPEMGPSALNNLVDDRVDTNDYLDPLADQQMLMAGGAGLGGLAVAGGIGALGASGAKAKLRRAGFSEGEVDNVLSTSGGALRGAGKTLGGAALGGGLGYGAGLLADKYLGGDGSYAGIGAGVGAGLGAGAGAYSGYTGEGERADEAIARAARSRTKKKR